jgi:ATP synthase protein I
MLLSAAVAALVAGALVVAIGAIASGAPAAYGALAGTFIVVGVFGFGAFTVNLVARVLPAAALLVAMLTYTLQVVLMAVIFLALTRSGLLEDALDRQWLAAAVITGTLVWLITQIISTMRARIPAFDLPPEAGVR